MCTYPPNMMCSSLKVKRWGVLTLHLPPNMMCLHIPPPTWCAQVSKSRGGGVLTLNIPPKHDVLKSQSQEVGGIDIADTPQHDVLTHTPPTWCAQVSKSRGGGYWHYTYPPHTHTHDVLKSPRQEVGGGYLHYTYPPNMMCSSLKVKRWGRGYGHYTHPTPHKMCSSLKVTTTHPSIYHNQPCLWQIEWYLWQIEWWGPLNLSWPNFRTSLVPAAMVIPTPLVYTNVAAVKELICTVGERWNSWTTTWDVKFLDHHKTNYCKSICQECFH